MFKDLLSRMFAALNVYKPQGITSHDVIARLRRVYGLKKIGHLGTLDPLAEGVLPACLGHATRLIEYFPDDKRYTAAVTLGRTTTTLDSAGETLSEADCSALDVSLERLESILSGFRGTICQQVPLYSAVHVNGKKLYQLAHAGKTADLPTRETTIHELTLLRVDGANTAHPVLMLDVACSSGTYIRSLARDIGESLGCGAYLSHLVRTEHGRFQAAQAIPLETIQASDDPHQFLQNPVSCLAIPPLEIVEPDAARLLSQGMKIPALPRLKPNGLYMALHQARPLGVVQCVAHQLKPVKMFPLLAEALIIAQ